MPPRRLRLGIAGLGRAFSIMLPAFASDKVEIVAGADPRAEAREQFGQEFQARTYATVEEMCADHAVEAVYVSTPHQFHCDNVRSAAQHGRHVLVEKPMALTLADCQTMIDTARAAGIVLIIGHSHSFDLPILKTREIIASGAVGELKMITSAYFTDFLYRPRRPEELDTAQGGGVMYNQAPHQVDVARLLGGGLVKSVRANLGAWDPARRTEGAYQALLTFQNGATASLTYSGYAHYDGDELMEGIAESGLPKDPSRYGAARRALAGASTQDDEEQIKNETNYGGGRYAGPQHRGAGARTERFHQHFGLVVASCEHADLRPTAKGVHIFADTERRFEQLRRPAIYRDEVIDELYGAVREGAPVVHSGEWGMATMEVCLAMLESHRSGREITLKHQVPVAERRGA
ncbi:MAG: Gfo/Idh/MocA family oxidoreductase [Hyphomicrobiaceae bacterium]